MAVLKNLEYLFYYIFSSESPKFKFTIEMLLLDFP